MPLASAYHRPQSIEEAVALLTAENRVALAGGTIVNADREHVGIEVVDLQSLELSGINSADDRIAIGAMTTLSTMASSEEIEDGLRQIAGAELPSTLRTRATIGGTVAAAGKGWGAESVLAATLLASGGAATVVDGTGSAEQSLVDLYANGLADGSLVTSVSIAAGGTYAVAGTGRTPADVPIVAAVAHRVGETTTVAVTGVAAAPVIVDPDDPGRGLEPPDDFRGSTEYRRHLAVTLTKRAVEALR